jgi:sortase A
MGAAGARQDLERFVKLQSAAGFTPDTSLWSVERIRAWHDTQDDEAPVPLAVLRIARLKIEVAVLEGTDEWTLNRAVGLIEDTARPGSGGNVGLAGHRDGFFRALKDIREGDAIELALPRGTEQYLVVRTWLVMPEDVSVLDPTGEPSITLVTCYPFYYVGSAPQRFIVRAVRQKSPGGRSS